MSHDSPRISGLLPTKNCGHYLVKLVPQVLSMLRESDELIVVDDGSTDSSSTLLKELSQLHKQLVVISTEGIGLVASLNLGIQHARNPWIARFDADDEYPQDRLEVQRGLIADDIAVIFSDYRVMSSSGRRLGLIPSAILSTPTKLSLVTAQRTPHPVALINRDMMITAGYYSLEDFPTEDLGLWLRLAHLGKIISTPKPLVSYRISKNSISGKFKTQQRRKRSFLICNSQIWEGLVNQSIEEWSKTVDFYLQQPNSVARVLLHLNDIRLASIATQKKFKASLFLSKLPFSIFFKTPFVLIHLISGSLIRRFYRLVTKLL